MKRFLPLFILCAVLLSLFSCKSDPSLEKSLSELEALVNEYGGKILIYRPSDGGDIPDAIISLYGKAGAPPDELALLEFAAIWYSDRFSPYDAAIFKLKNATDAASLVKMCRRRANTVYLTAGARSIISCDGHYVRFYNLE